MIAASGCAVEAAVESVRCTSSFDCADGERCTAGVCEAEDREIIKIPLDAGIAGSPDTGLVDSGSSVADTGRFEPEVDAGSPPDSGCSAGITVVELPGASFCTIASAIAAAPSAGHIDIPGAIYDESLSIDKPLTLRGPGLDGVTIRAVAGEAVLSITSPDVFLEWLILEGNGAVGVMLSGRASFTNVTVQNTTGAAVFVEGVGAHLEAREFYVSRVSCNGTCTPEDWGEGLVFMHDTTGTLTDITIEDTDYIGLYVDDAGVTMSGGWIHNAGRTRCAGSADHCMPGVYLFNDAAVTIENDSWIEDSGGAGIDSEEATLILRNSHVERNGMRDLDFLDGILLYKTNATLEDNVISNNRCFGVRCESSAMMSCVRNTHELNQFGWTNGACGGC